MYEVNPCHLNRLTKVVDIFELGDNNHLLILLHLTVMNDLSKTEFEESLSLYQSG